MPVPVIKEKLGWVILCDPPQLIYEKNSGQVSSEISGLTERPNTVKIVSDGIDKHRYVLKKIRSRLSKTIQKGAL